MTLVVVLAVCVPDALSDRELLVVLVAEADTFIVCDPAVPDCDEDIVAVVLALFVSLPEDECDSDSVAEALCVSECDGEIDAETESEAEMLIFCEIDGEIVPEVDGDAVSEGDIVWDGDADPVKDTDMLCVVLPDVVSLGEEVAEVDSVAVREDVADGD